MNSFGNNDELQPDLECLKQIGIRYRESMDNCGTVNGQFTSEIQGSDDGQQVSYDAAETENSKTSFLRNICDSSEENRTVSRRESPANTCPDPFLRRLPVLRSSDLFIERLEAAHNTILSLEAKVGELVRYMNLEDMSTRVISSASDASFPIHNPILTKNDAAPVALTEETINKKHLKMEHSLGSIRPTELPVKKSSTPKCGHKLDILASITPSAPLVPNRKFNNQKNRPRSSVILSKNEHVTRSSVYTPDSWHSDQQPISDTARTNIRNKTTDICRQLSGKYKDGTSFTPMSTSAITIHQIDSYGRYIRLANISHTETDISRWHLKQCKDGFPISVYRFPNRLRIMPFSILTIWSSNTPLPIAESASNIVAQTISTWTFANGITTMLCNSGSQAVTWTTQ